MGFYIIEINDKYKQVVLLSAEGELYCKDVAGLMPYIEPDLEQIRKEAYDKGYEDCRDELDLGEIKNNAFDDGYKCGLDDAWDAAKKIALMDTETSENVTGYFGLFRIMNNLTASEAIAKIKAWEEKQEELHVGDVVTFKTAYGEKSGIVVECHVPDVYPDVDKYIVWCGGRVEYIVKEGLSKTGTHFSEVADLLERLKNMKEGQEQ